MVALPTSLSSRKSSLPQEMSSRRERGWLLVVLFVTTGLISGLDGGEFALAGLQVITSIRVPDESYCGAVFTA
jgi:hypothetical protein